MKYLSLFEKHLSKKKQPSPHDLIANLDFAFSWRSIFDNSSSEWIDIEPEEKIAILKLLVTSGYSLMVLAAAYEMYYTQKGREDIAKDKMGILDLFEYALKTLGK